MKLTLIIAWLVATGATLITSSQQEQPGYIYAVAFEKSACGGNSFLGWAHMVVDKKEYRAKMEDLKSRMKKEYPNATDVKVGSSFFEYGSKVKYLYAITWTRKGNCVATAWTVAFGKTATEAETKAMKAKNNAAPGSTHSILANTYIPTVVHAVE